VSAAVTSNCHRAAGSAAAASNVVGSVYAAVPFASTAIDTFVFEVEDQGGDAVDQTVTLSTVTVAALPAVS
jgi:hypothetical protein